MSMVFCHQNILFMAGFEDYTLIMLTKKTADRLIYLADKYETKDFLTKDPSQFMHRYTDPAEMEIAAFLAANMAFGRRDQILSHTETVLQAAGTDLLKWVQNKGYRKFFTKGDSSYYRMYTHNDFLLFFDTVCTFIKESDTIGNHFKKIYTHPDNKENYLTPLICNLFSENCHLTPHSKGTAAKRINMFLRWMVRDNSPVDLGLWKDWYSKKNLLIPLDTHVMQEAATLSLFQLSKNGNVPSASFKTDVQLTNLMETVFPGDPCRADYALFGFGVDKDADS